MLIAYHSPPEHRLFQINDFCSLRDFWICISKFKNSGFPSLLLCSHLHGLLRSRRDGHEPNTLNQSWDSPLMVICFLLDKHKFSEIPFQKSSLQTFFLSSCLLSKLVNQTQGKKYQPSLLQNPELKFPLLSSLLQVFHLVASNVWLYTMFTVL